MPDLVDHFLAEVRAEVARARSKFPGNDLTTIALTEEVGELAKALLDESPSRVRSEAVQVAAMAVRVAIDGDASVANHRMLKQSDGRDAISKYALTEDQLVELTQGLEEHPDWWDGPCSCKTCMSYASDDGDGDGAAFRSAKG